MHACSRFSCKSGSSVARGVVRQPELLRVQLVALVVLRYWG